MTELVRDIECLPDKSPRIALTRLEHVRSELATLYREAKSGKRDTQEATRLAYILTAIAKLITDHELEKRIEQLEAKQNESKNTSSSIGGGSSFL